MKIAIIQFPGTNCEYETRRAVNRAGMEGEFFRWNQDHKELKNYDGFVIPGGFSYEDRVRAGVIASLDPIMNVIKDEAEKGKPALGICNGAQILVESGLIPGLNRNSLASALAVNKRVKEGKVLGTGFYNTWCNIKNNSKKGRSAYTSLMEKGEHFKLPLAHGEGRFVIEEKLLEKLKESGQALFRYCDDEGRVIDEFPNNPNGSVYSLAGVCNARGNVVALMPHPERTQEGQVIFQSIKKYIENGANQEDISLEYNLEDIEIGNYKRGNKNLELFVDLIITDNEAETLKNALRHMGFENVGIKKQVHWEIEYKDSGDDLEKFARELILSNELLNTSKEIVSVRFDNKIMKFDNPEFSEIEKDKVLESDNCYLVRYKDDFVGQSKLDILKNQLGFKKIKSIKKGLVWQVRGSDVDLDKIIKTNIFYNSYSQDCHRINL